MSILKKFHFYKRGLQILIAVNMAVLVSGAIAAVSYFGSVHFMRVLTHQNTDRMEMLTSMETDVYALSSVAQTKKPTTSYLRHLEALRYKLEQWPDGAFAQIVIPDNAEELTLPENLLNAMHDRIIKEQKSLTEQLEEGSSKLQSLGGQLAILGICTLIFGILLPMMLFRHVSKEVAETRHKVEEKVSHWIAEWFEAHGNHGETPFQDPMFWLKMILVSIETFAPQSRHPVMHFLSEFAPTLRKEIDHERRSHKKKSA